jgi:C-terminal processing protease CtpA/Prc
MRSFHKSVKDMNTTEAANLLKGAEGTKVQLTLRKGGEILALRARYTLIMLAQCHHAV